MPEVRRGKKHPPRAMYRRWMQEVFDWLMDRGIVQRNLRPLDEPKNLRERGLRLLLPRPTTAFPRPLAQGAHGRGDGGNMHPLRQNIKQRLAGVRQLLRVVGGCRRDLREGGGGGAEVSWLPCGASVAVKLTSHARPGRCRCLRCGRQWESPDLRRRRICDRCTYSESALGRERGKPLTLADRILRLTGMGPMDARQLARCTGASLSVVQATLSRLKRLRQVRGDGGGARYGQRWRRGNAGQG